MSASRAFQRLDCETPEHGDCRLSPGIAPLARLACVTPAAVHFAGGAASARVWAVGWGKCAVFCGTLSASAKPQAEMSAKLVFFSGELSSTHFFAVACDSLDNRLTQIAVSLGKARL